MTKNKWVIKYISCVATISVFIFIIALIKFKIGFDAKTLIYFIIFGAGVIIADKFPIVYFPHKENQAEITISLALTFTAAFAFQPVHAILLMAIANILAELIIRKRNFFKKWFRVVFNTAYLSIVVGITSILFHKLYNPQLNFLSFHNILVLTLGGIVYFATETFILFGLLSYLNNEQFFKYWIKNVKAAQLELLTLFPLGYLLIYIYIKNFWVAILLVPLFIAIYFASKEKVDIVNQTEKTLYALATIEDDKFPDTKKHSDRVSNLTEELCSRLNISEDEKDIIVKAARLHDIGKIAIPDWILEKPNKLTKEEFEIVKKHSEKGKEIVKNLSAFKEGPEIILHHHERWDGMGYPDGLRKKEIPFGSRIITVVDSFDAMISNRPYKNPRTIKGAIEEIQKNKGEQFDPEVADTFCKMINYIVKNKKDDFSFYFPINFNIG